MVKRPPKDELRAVVDRLQVLFPTLYPVIFRRVKWPPGELGDCAVVLRKGKKKTLIRINANYDKYIQEVVLRHEYAHAMQERSEAQELRRERDHDAEYGVARGLIEWGLCEMALWQLEETAG